MAWSASQIACSEDPLPTYQYTCTSCGEPLEVVQKFTDEPLTECPSCHGRLRKVYSAVGVVFKGSGFYKTDSRSAKSSSSAPAKETVKEPAKEPASSTGSTDPGPSSSATPAGGSSSKPSSTTSGDSSKVA